MSIVGNSSLKQEYIFLKDGKNDAMSGKYLRQTSLFVCKINFPGLILVRIMALPVMEFQDQGYKIRKAFA